MTAQAELLPGTLDLLVLKAVSFGERLGYRVLLCIERVSGGAPQIQRGAPYRARYRLEHQGPIESEWERPDDDPRATFDPLTAAGRRLGVASASWNRLVEAVVMALAITPREVR